MTLGTRDHLRRGPCPAHRVRERPRDRPAATLGRGLWRARAPWGRSRRLQHSAARCSTAPRVATGGAPSPCTADCRGTPPAPPTHDGMDEADWCRRVSNRDEAIDREASRPGPAEPAMDRDSAPAENRRQPWTDMELAGREEGAPLRGVDEPASAGGCCCEAEPPCGHSPTIVPSSRSSSPATTSQPLSAPPPTSCRGRPRFPSRRDCAWTRCAASALPSVKRRPACPRTPPAASTSASRRSKVM